MNDNGINCLSHWFPKIEAAGLPVPNTKIVRTGADLIHLLDGREPAGWDEFITGLHRAVDDIGAPCFLRTGQGSGKHQWQDTCYLRNAQRLKRHVAALVEWSECVQLIGLPYNVWAVREMLPTQPVTALLCYGNMRLCREFRCFVDDGVVRCVHPYWPRESILQGMIETPVFFDELYDSLSELSGPEELRVRQLAGSAGKAVGGSWSVDILHTSKGWYVTDMANAEQSFHWEGCEKADAVATHTAHTTSEAQP